MYMFLVLYGSAALRAFVDVEYNRYLARFGFHEIDYGLTAGTLHHVMRIDFIAAFGTQKPLFSHNFSGFKKKNCPALRVVASGKTLLPSGRIYFYRCLLHKIPN